MVNLVQVLHVLQLLVWDLLLLSPVAGRLQELQATGRDGGDHLREGWSNRNTVKRCTSDKIKQVKEESIDVRCLNGTLGCSPSRWR